MRTGGQVGFSFGKGVPGRDRRAKAVLVEKQELPLGHSERSVFVLLGPPNNSPFVIKPASSSWRTGGACHLCRQREAASARGSAVTRGEENSHLSFLSPRQRPVSGAALPHQRCMPCLIRDACHPTIWPPNVDIQGILCSSLYPLLDPSPSLEQQLGSNLHFQLHHLPGRAAHDPLL